MKPTSPLLLLLLVLGPVVSSLGCASMVLPAAPAEEDVLLLAATHFDAVVAVEAGSPPVYGERLARELRQTGLFDRVEMADALDVEPDLIATVTQLVYGTATIPILAIVTLGVIPSWADEEWGEVFRLSAPGSITEPSEAKESPGSVEIDFRYEGATILGWIATVANLSPRRTHANPRTSGRYTQALAVELVRREGLIRALLDE